MFSFLFGESKQKQPLGHQLTRMYIQNVNDFAACVLCKFTGSTRNFQIQAFCNVVSQRRGARLASNNVVPRMVTADDLGGLVGGRYVCGGTLCVLCFSVFRCARCTLTFTLSRCTLTAPSHESPLFGAVCVHEILCLFACRSSCRTLYANFLLIDCQHLSLM